jgi:phosphoglycerate dehydrogenase-like enzyme
MHDEIMARGAHLTTTHVQSVAIAEFVVRSALDYFHDAPSWWAGHEQRSWERRRFREIYGTTWLVIGMGAIGSDVARRASPFGVPLIGMRRHPTGAEPVDEVVPPGDLGAVGRADVIVVAAPATAETHHLVDERFLAAAKPGSLLVNVARGALINETALVAALDRGQLGGAVLDVTAREPLPPDDPLWAHPASSFRRTPRLTATARSPAPATCSSPSSSTTWPARPSRTKCRPGPPPDHPDTRSRPTTAARRRRRL